MNKSNEYFKCQYCGSLFKDLYPSCPNCGATEFFLPKKFEGQKVIYRGVEKKRKENKNEKNPLPEIDFTRSLAVCSRCNKFAYECECEDDFFDKFTDFILSDFMKFIEYGFLVFIIFLLGSFIFVGCMDFIGLGA
jgi:hypothetical protein